MTHQHVVKSIAILIIASLLNACASSNAGDVYSRDEARKIQTIRKGVVESVRTVKLEGTKTPIGTATGAVIGGVGPGTHVIRTPNLVEAMRNNLACRLWLEGVSVNFLSIVGSAHFICVQLL